MAASESLNFKITADDRASDAFSRAGRSVSEFSAKMDVAAAKSMFLDDALKRQAETARRSADASLALAKSDAILAEVEGRLRDGALEAEFALKKEADAKKKSADASRDATKANDGFFASLQKIADGARKGGGPWWLGPALGLAPVGTSLLGAGAGAAIGLGGAAVAGGGALAAFGAVAKPVLADALKAEQAVQQAQDAYTLSVQKTVGQYQIAMSVAKTQAQRNAAYAAEQKGFAADRLAEAQAISKAYIEMSPQQIALSKQLGDMAQAWHNLKAAETPVVAGALQPWLKSVTDLTGKLGPIIGAVSPVIGLLGTDVDRLVNSPAFAGFRDFVAGTGSWAVAAAGGTVVDLVKSFLILLPKFNPLIEKTVGWIGGLGPAALKWSSSKKASDDITRFMAWFTANGPVVGQLLGNIGGALKALAPGLGPASVTEMNMISGFFGLIAKLPPSVAKPLLEVAGAMLTLNKLGVVSVGVKLLGLGGAGAGAGAGEAAAGGAAAGLWSKMLPGVRLVGGTLAAVLVIDTVLRNTSSGQGKNWFDNPFGMPGPKDPKSSGNWLTSWAPYERFITKTIPSWYDESDWAVSHIWDLTWHNTIDRLNNGVNDSDRLLSGWEHNVFHWFDTARHDTAATWDMTWSNTIGRLNNGMNDTDRLLGGWEHNVFHWFDTARHDTAATWDTVWNNTVGRAQRGVGDVVRWVAALPGKITGAVGKAASVLYGWGTGVINGLLSGFRSAWSAVANFFSGLPKTILGLLGIHSPPAWAISAGQWIMNGVGIGMGKAHGAVANMASRVAATVAGALGGAPGQIQGLMRQMAAARGWTGAQWNALNSVEMREAGYNLNARNPVSGAYGLAQFINGPGEYYAWGGNPGSPSGQISAMLAYIASRYGTPSAAWQHELSFGWYDGGGVLGKGLTLAYNGTGHDEYVYTSRPGGGGGQTIVFEPGSIVIHAPAGNGREIGRQLADYLGQHIKGGGRIYPAGTAPR